MVDGYGFGRIPLEDQKRGRRNGGYARAANMTRTAREREGTARVSVRWAGKNAEERRAEWRKGRNIPEGAKMD